ncbi:MAG: ABC transporter substrate-binding protein [Ruminococcus bromii]|jgi:iron complex transport system substrate-binding protein|nr:ABC transporter substrate-binding protein [Bacteroidaceae bacterium]MEE0839783.1 ABC transporter substrate-binding protein [Acutalibacteraceae bacterium]MEE0963850.1 ABC transporter substrate-binding protein [Ruminococcus bromii]
MRKCFKIIAIIICFSVLSSLLTACSSEQNEYDQSAVIFTDALGREVSVPKEPERVAALIGSFADVWMLAGGSVCATAEDAWDDFGLALPDAVNIGGAHSPNLELIFSVNPDFVIASASTSSNVEMKETLEAAGIAVAYFDVDNFSDYLAMLDICTDITERKDLYECNGLAIQSQIEDIKQAIEERALPEEQRTVLLLRAHSSSVKAKGSKGTILGEMLADLGCINIADSDTSLLETLSVESIIRQEPYRIFVVTMGDDTEKAIDNLNQMMNENPAWGTLDAVAEGRLHLMERKLFNIKPNADWAESYEKLSEILLTE